MARAVGGSRDHIDGVPELLPISLVAHHAFCPRRAWLEAMGEKVDSFQMAVGTDAHTRSDDPSASRTRVQRAVEVASLEFGVIGRCDAIEIGIDGRATVVEFKATPVRRRCEVTEPAVVQLALQVAALREAGVTVAAAAVWFTEHRTRVDVPIGPVELELARSHADGVRSVLAEQTAPPPLEDDPRCRRCSHADVCLPEERHLGVVRRPKAADPHADVVHMATPGSRASIRSGRLRIVKGLEELGSIPIERVHALVVHGNCDVSSGLLRELLWRRLPVVWCSGTGRVVGWASSASSPNGAVRVRQHVLSERGHLELARAFIGAKIGNQATLLRRHGEAADVAAELRAMQRRAAAARSQPELFGIEGEAAARYFECFTTMLRPNVRSREGLAFSVRSRRPARDPVNAALNFCYGLLLTDVIRAVVSCGLDPHAGFLHSSGRNKPALALDIGEEFRAPVADAVVVAAFNNGELKASAFSDAAGTTRLREAGRAALIKAYERRVQTQFLHPVFGYRVTWRRAMEVQARLVLGVIDGTQSGYRGVVIR